MLRAKYRTIIHFPFLLDPCFLPFYTNLIPILYATNFLIENVFITCFIYFEFLIMTWCPIGLQEYLVAADLSRYEDGVLGSTNGV